MALVAALLFPVVYGGMDLIRNKKFNFISALGFISVLLTGGIGLLELDTRWLALKANTLSKFHNARLTHFYLRRKFLAGELRRLFCVFNNPIADQTTTLRKLSTPRDYLIDN